ncbi:MAG: NADH-ubiquinone oxidoreductase-F iron-sulfur binding region domain-containing protein [Acidimicrobiales bacterium]|nr:NADH-ubiquinone oxidoreductase-F iron-sulfur binding region domain-containing protein [Acidimicrobiales bacterium]
MPGLLDGTPVDSLHVYEARGGGVALGKVDELGPDGVIDELDRSGLRGRGGAGFPTATKWRSIAEGGVEAGERYVVANGAEGEPGTFKDRAILRHDPYPLVEGVLVAARTIGARRAFIALKSSFTREADRVAEAVAEVSAAGWAPEVEVDLVQGPDEYLFGEEKALLEVIEGEDPLPRMFPPYIYGLFTRNPQFGWSAGSTGTDFRPDGANPTLVNNIETLSTIPGILRNGADWHCEFGTAESPGTIICTVSGDTVRHGVGEFELGTPVRDVLFELGDGLPEGRALKYVLSGVSNPILRGEDVHTPLTYEHMEAAGAGLGTGGLIVYDETTDPVELARAVSQFLSVESCGQCPACKLGTMTVTDILDQLGPETESRLFAQLTGRLGQVADAARCFLPTQEQNVVASLLSDMRDPSMRAPERGLLVTKLVDIVDGRFVVDEKQARKRPDWTFADT